MVEGSFFCPHSLTTDFLAWGLGFQMKLMTKRQNTHEFFPVVNPRISTKQKYSHDRRQTSKDSITSWGSVVCRSFRQSSQAVEAKPGNGNLWLKNSYHSPTLSLRDNGPNRLARRKQLENFNARLDQQNTLTPWEPTISGSNTRSTTPNRSARTRQKPKHTLRLYPLTNELATSLILRSEHYFTLACNRSRKTHKISCRRQQMILVVYWKEE